MVDGSAYDLKRAGRAGWVMAGLFCAAVLMFFVGLWMWSQATPRPTYVERCPKEFPLRLVFDHESYCLPGTRPTRVLKEEQP